MKSRLILLVTTLSIITLIIFWVIIQLDVKFSFGGEQNEYIFNKGQELGNKSSIFIGVLIFFNVLIFLIQIMYHFKNKNIKM